MFLRSALAALAALSACVIAQAQPQGQGDRPAGPPPEAIKACEAKKSGDACHFTTPRGKEDGSCWAPEGRPLACRPKGAPAGGPPGGSRLPQKN